ncbi:MAG: arylsulfatase [Bacteroides sp.]|nr:arylsulfatase [Bacteroides sp.]
MMLKNEIILLLFILLPLTGCGAGKAPGSFEGPPPNIIYILADDLGYGDLACYGQEKFSTPHLDKLASEGVRFTRHYAGCTVCAPSRSVLMTGLHTGHTPIRGNQEVRPEGQSPLPASTFTLAEMLQSAGYVTGAFGKWGLGYPGSEGEPLKQGFDTFFGYNCQRYAHRYYPEYLWEDDQKYYLEGNDWTSCSTYAPDLIQERTLQFIRQHKDSTFFAYVPIVIPHAELIVPDDEVYESYLGRFPEVSYQGRPGADYGPGLLIPMYCSQEHPHATFAAMVHRIDVYVGEILSTLEELGIAENTVLMFTSDNGPHEEGGADPQFFNSSGGLRGVKRDLYEGGLRVPMLVSWPGQIEGGRSSDHISAFWDVLPTLAGLAGIEAPSSDGISFLPELTGGEQAQHDFLYWEFHEQGGKQAMLKNNWKAVRLQVGKDPEGALELYNLESDPEEAHNVAAEYPDLVEEFERAMKMARVPSENFNFGKKTH